MTAAIVGEPTSHNRVGDTMKIGRRGSMTGKVELHGRQGHIAYPHRALSAVGPLLDLIDRLRRRELDTGMVEFQPSNLEVTQILCGEAASNILPGEGLCRFGVRYNTLHSGKDLEAWVRGEVAAVTEAWGISADVDIRHPGRPFLCSDEDFLGRVSTAIASVTGTAPERSTSGGSSDARFLAPLMPVAEVGLVGHTMHQVNECVALNDLGVLEGIYRRMVEAHLENAR
jgi:succinyl-diaminopimelate desuccinylase